MKSSQTLRLIVFLFVSFRVLTLLLYRHGGFYGDASDYGYYFELARLSDRGKLPLIHFWSEYPPILPWLAVGAYQIGQLLPPAPHPRFWFTAILGGTLLLAEVGNLILVFRLARRVAGEDAAIQSAWIYAALFAPIFIWTGWFDSLVVFWLLLSLDLLIARRFAWSGVACGVGFLVKVVPVVVGLTALRLCLARLHAVPSGFAEPPSLPGHGESREPPRIPRPERVRAQARTRTARPTDLPEPDGPADRGAPPSHESVGHQLARHGALFVRPLLRFGGAAAMTVAVGLAPFVLLAPRTLLASVRSWADRPPWETVWALIDGYYWYGMVPSLLARVDVPTSLQWPNVGTGLWPLVLVGVAALAIGRIRVDPEDVRGLIATTALTLNAIVLLGSAFSPQFIGWLVPFMVILLPAMRAAIYVTTITVLSLFLERFVYFGMDPTSPPLLAGIVAARSVVILAVSAEYLGDLLAFVRWSRASWFTPLRRQLPMASTALALAIVVFALGPGSQLLQWPEMPRVGWEPAQAIRAVTGSDEGLIAVDDRVYQGLHASLMDRPFYLVGSAHSADGDDGVADSVAALAAKHPVLYLVRRAGSDPTPDEREVIEALRLIGQENSPLRIGDLALEPYHTTTLPSSDVGPAVGPPLAPYIADFDGRLQLVGYSVFEQPTGDRGHDLRLLLVWQVPRPVSASYAVTAQLWDATGRLVAVTDNANSGALAVGAWQPGQRVVDLRNLRVQSSEAQGPYRVSIALRNRDTGEPLNARTVDGTRVHQVDLVAVTTELVDAPKRPLPGGSPPSSAN